MITRIEASNYRCFAKLSIDVDRYQVLAGANGSGKTTLLDIPILFGDLLQAQRVADAFLRPDCAMRAPRASSFPELLHGGRGSELMFAVEARLPGDVEAVLLSLNSILDSQVWISTHSPIALARTKLTDILAARVHDDGSVDVIRGEQHPRLRDWRGSIDTAPLVPGEAAMTSGHDGGNV